MIEDPNYLTDWRVALLLAGQEAAGLLALTAARIPALWPRWEESATRLGRRVTVVRPLVSGYLLIRFDAGDPVLWHRVRALARAYAFIGDADPAPVAPAEMARLLERCLTDDGLLEPPAAEAARAGYAAGDAVRVVGIIGEPPGVVTWADAAWVRGDTYLFGRATPFCVPNDPAYLRPATREEKDLAKALVPQHGRRWRRAAA